MFTYPQCFSSDCGYCSSCNDDKKSIIYNSPFNEVFENTHGKEVKDIISKTKDIKNKGISSLDSNIILGKVLSIKTKSVYIPLEKYIAHEKELIKKNEEKHVMYMLENYTDEDGSRETLIRRLPQFDPAGLPDLTPGVVDIPYQIPDYTDKNVMKKIDDYREEYWKNMEILKKKYNFQDHKKYGDIPKNVIISDKQFNVIKLPDDIKLQERSSFRLLKSYNYSCDNILCLDMSSIYCAETRTLDIPIYTHNKEFELCGLCLLGRPWCG